MLTRGIDYSEPLDDMELEIGAQLEHARMDGQTTIEEDRKWAVHHHLDALKRVRDARRILGMK